MLIVCEGEKTEPNYFRGLCSTHRLSSANIRVVQSPGSDPMSIVQAAESEMEKNDYDRVFCVFDRDGHANFDAAVQRIAHSKAGKALKFQAIVSWPCFEMWILLHFVYTTQAFTASGGRTSCENVIRLIEPHYPGYKKGSKDIYDSVFPTIADALTRGRQLEAHNRATNTSNPATAVHLLVDYLRNLRKK